MSRRCLPIRGPTIAAAFSLLLTTGVWSATIHVPADQSTIQAAIDAAGSGDVVVVHPATYNERIDFKGKAIVVRSVNANDPATVAATIIDGQACGTVVSFVSGEGPGSVIRGLTIRNGQSFSDGDYHLNGRSPCIDAGADLEWMRGGVDMDGVARIAGGQCDMGPYESPAGGAIFMIR